MSINTIEADLLGHGVRIGIVLARWNEFVGDALLKGAVAGLRRHGVEESGITVVHVPGAFEIPLALKAMAESGDYDGLLALGAVIRGSTPHFEYVAGECVKGMAQVNMQSGIPVSFGVLTVDTIEQAIERSGTKAGNKGEEAALSALEMVNLMKKLKG